MTNKGRLICTTLTIIILKGNHMRVFRIFVLLLCMVGSPVQLPQIYSSLRFGAVALFRTFPWKLGR